MVSLEKPLEPGACTSKTSGLASSPSLVVNHRESTEATSAGSRWAISGMGRESTQLGGQRKGAGNVGGRAHCDGSRQRVGRPAGARRLRPLLGGGSGGGFGGGAGGGGGGHGSGATAARRDPPGGRSGCPAPAGRGGGDAGLGGRVRGNVHVRRREGLGGGRRGHPGPYRASGRGGLS